MKYSITIDENNVITAMYLIGSSDEPKNAIPIEDQIANSIMNVVAPQWFKYINNALENNDAFIAEYTAQESQNLNKSKAISLLQQTDWTTIPDVADPALSNPYLTNQAEFITFRNQVRPIAINPVAGNLTWPTVPVATWSN